MPSRRHVNLSGGGNYGGVLLIWDHLFGSYRAERPDIPIRYGLVHSRTAPNNPLVIAYEEFWQTLKATLRAGSAREGLAKLWGPP
jgi:sterol desaturase/sphingolipid hydroxylase (fatty acid hydroxylase superfamily)